MNKAITDGVILQPPAFEDGLDVWSSGDGTPGSDTYENSATAAFVPADQDFGGCLELQKVDATTRIRYMGETPMLPGCYLRITTRIKAIAGNLPTVRIAAYAGRAGGLPVTGIPLTGPATTITSYGDIYEISAIVGSGGRGGVDMVWGTQPLYGHFGLDLTGPNGSVLRVDDFTVEDVTSAFVGDVLARVDVRDYGAVGDGTTDDLAAFNAADSDANGREVLVPEGLFYLSGNMTFDNPVIFVGTLTMPRTAQLTLRKNFDLPAYIEAMGDETEGFKKAFQALMDFSDFESLDMRGRRVDLAEPLDLAAAVPSINGFSVGGVIRNGQFACQTTPAFEDTVITAVASYNASNPRTMTNVQNIASIAVGSLIEGVGVGREIYVKSKNEAAGTLEITQPFYGAPSTQSYTFTRFKYALDFSGFVGISKFNLDDIEFQCRGQASGVMLAPGGDTFQLRDCYVTRPKDRCITSPGSGCQDLLIDRCHFNSDEQSLKVQDRKALVFNTNGNDVKIRDNRASRFKSFGVIGGSGTIMTGNHWFMGDDETDGVRVGGLIFANANVKAMITGNYVDNNIIEWTNEYEPDPDFGNQFSFSGLTLTGNIFTVNDVAPWFTFLSIKPYGVGHFIQGLTMTGNVFQALNGAIDRVEGVNTTFADLEFSRMRNIQISGNTFNSVAEPIFNPASVLHTQSSESTAWTVDFLERLPFGGRARFVESVVPIDAITDGGAVVTQGFYADPGQGPDLNQVDVRWPVSCKGKVSVTARMDNPW